MSDSDRYSKDAVFERVRNEAKRVHVEKFESGYTTTRLGRRVQLDESFSVAAMTEDGDEDYIAFKKGDKAIYMQVPRVFIDEDSLQPLHARPGFLRWSVGEYSLKVKDIDRDHIELKFGTLTERMEQIMIFVMGHTTNKTEPSTAVPT